MGLASESDQHLACPTRGDSPSSSTESAAFTPESTEEDSFRGDEVGMPTDPLLLRAGQEGGEAYELREGVGRKAKSERLGLEEAYYHDSESAHVLRDEEVEEREEEDGDDIVYTVDEERAVVRKFDRRLVLFVALLYLLSFLDRSSESSPLFLFLHHFLPGFISL